MRFLLDTGAEISMIPPCRYYKPYHGLQDLVSTNGTPIRIFGTKKLNIDVGARYTRRWTFKVADVAVPIIGIDFLRHFGLGIDVMNNTFLLPQNSMYRRHHASQTQSNFVNRISCTNASDAIKSHPSSASSNDVTNKFPLEAFAAYNAVRNVDAVNTIAHSVHDQPKHFAAAPSVHDAAILSFQQRPEDPPAKSYSKPRRSPRSLFSYAFNVNVPRHNAPRENYPTTSNPCPPPFLMA